MTFSEYIETLHGKTAAVIGIGISNRPLIEALAKAGIAVSACDRQTDLGAYGQKLQELGVQLHLGPDYLQNLNAEVIFRTPGIRPDVPELKTAIANGSVLTSEMEVFFQVCPCPILAVTGSDGKTTTTTIIAGLLSAAGQTVHIGGNIGRPLLTEADSMAPTDLAVLELSSFQLLTMRSSPHIAVVTNLAPNHLDVHRDMEEYVSAKANIFAHQTASDRVILNADNEYTRAFAARARGAVTLFSRREEPAGDAVFLRDGTIYVKDGSGVRSVLLCGDILLPGVHNVENYMAAIAAVKERVPTETIQQYARTFGGVEHRIELVRTLDGVRYYNDSIASSPSRTIAGLHSFDRKVILIAGGKDKGISYAPLGTELNEHVKLLILCGATAKVIREAAEQAENYHGLEIIDVDGYQEAVTLARSRAVSGDVVILSPASTSFDRFRNFEERGRTFKKIVNEL